MQAPNIENIFLAGGIIFFFDPGTGERDLGLIEEPLDVEPKSSEIKVFSTIGVQAGCISVVLVLLALGGGLLLDQVFNTKPLFVLGLLLLSIPVSLYAMVRSVLAASRSMRESSASETPQKEDGSGEQAH